MPLDNSEKETDYWMKPHHHPEVQSVTLSERPEFDEPYQWRRLSVFALYHSFRTAGGSHEQALSDVIVALPGLFLNDSGEVVYNQESRPQT